VYQLNTRMVHKEDRGDKFEETNGTIKSSGSTDFYKKPKKIK